MRFGVSEHLSNSFCWFGTSHGSDKTGPLAGVPYDGAGPENADLYHDYSQMPADFVEKVANAPAKGSIAMSREGPDSWRINYFNRILDVVNQHQPDLLYTDGGIPFGEDGLAIVAHLYNTSMSHHGGKVEAIYTSKSRPDAESGMCMLDVERGVVDGIWPRAWQTDTCIGNWHYDTRAKYKTPKRVIDMLVDIVSRNGNLLLNFPLPNSGMPDDKEMDILESITAWMAVNSEGIYASRPYKIFGARPRHGDQGGQRAVQRDQSPGPDRRGCSLHNEGRYALRVRDGLARSSKPSSHRLLPTQSRAWEKSSNVELLGAGKMKFIQNETALTVQLPEKQPSEHAIAFKIIGA